MSDNPPTFTHFSSTAAELPISYYTAIGRALYRWSQLEATVCSIAASIQGPFWLQALKELRGSRGFAVKKVFQQLRAAAQRRESPSQVLQDLSNAERLYSLRKTYFHSVWGHITGPNRAGVGMQEWSNDTYDNFKAVELSELEAFAADCAATSEGLMKTAIPLFHSSPTIAVDDGDGLTKALEWSPEHRSE